MSMSWLALMGALAQKLIRCPKCGNPITKTEDYHNDIQRIPQIGGSDIIFSRGEEVTLVCEKCGWKERTDNWRQYLQVQ